MPWVLDGNNLAGGRDRAAVRAAALALARSQRIRIVLFFDGAPPPGCPAVESLGRVEVRYVAYADAAILAMLSTSGAGWRLVTDDIGLGHRARANGAEVTAGQAFWTRMAEVPATAEPAARVDVDRELEYFASGRERTDGDRPRRVPRRRRRT